MTIKQIESRAGRTGMLVGEFLFVGGILFASMVASVLILGNLNPLGSSAITGLFGVVALIGLCHHLWYRSHRDEVESSYEHHQARERRGY